MYCVEPRQESKVSDVHSDVEAKDLRGGRFKAAETQVFLKKRSYKRCVPAGLGRLYKNSPPAAAMSDCPLKKDNYLII